jgi:hypothetical protein
MGARELIISLAAELSTQNDVAHDLWTWLPSHRASTKRGDASIVQPSVADVMREATDFISALEDALGPDAYRAVIDAMSARSGGEWSP